MTFVVVFGMLTFVSKLFQSSTTAQSPMEAREARFYCHRSAILQGVLILCCGGALLTEVVPSMDRVSFLNYQVSGGLHCSFQLTLTLRIVRITCGVCEIP